MIQNKLYIKIFLIVIAYIFMPMYVFAGSTVVYNGVLATDDGQTVRNTVGQVNMIFTFYDNEFDGNAIQSFTQYVTVSNGKFKVNLPVDTLSEKEDYWVDLQINGESLGRSHVDLTTSTNFTNKSQTYTKKPIFSDGKNQESKKDISLSSINSVSYYKKDIKKVTTKKQDNKEKFKQEVKNDVISDGFVKKYITSIMSSIKKIYERITHNEKIMEYNKVEINKLHTKDREFDGRIKRLETEVFTGE